VDAAGAGTTAEPADSAVMAGAFDMVAETVPSEHYAQLLIAAYPRVVAGLALGQQQQMMLNFFLSVHEGTGMAILAAAHAHCATVTAAAAASVAAAATATTASAAMHDGPPSVAQPHGVGAVAGENNAVANQLAGIVALVPPAAAHPDSPSAAATDVFLAPHGAAATGHGPPRALLGETNLAASHLIPLPLLPDELAEFAAQGAPPHLAGAADAAPGSNDGNGLENGGGNAMDVELPAHADVAPAAGAGIPVHLESAHAPSHHHHHPSTGHHHAHLGGMTGHWGFHGPGMPAFAAGDAFEAAGFGLVPPGGLAEGGGGGGFGGDPGGGDPGGGDPGGGDPGGGDPGGGDGGDGGGGGGGGGFDDVILSDEVFGPVVARFSNLRSLKLEGARHVTNVGVSYLARCAGLERLSVTASPQVSDEGLAPVVAKAAGLKLLHLSELGRVGDVTIDALAAAPAATFESLSMSGNARVTDRAMRLVVNACESLQQVRLAECANLTNATLSHLSCARHLQQLALAMPRASPITNRSATYLSCAASSLTELSLGECLKLGADGFVALSKLPGLSKLCLHGLGLVSTDSLGVLGSNSPTAFPRLNHLVLEGSMQLTTLGVMLLCCKNGHNIRHLELRDGTRNLTDEVLDQFFTWCTVLRFLRVDGNFSSDAVHKFHDNKPDLSMTFSSLGVVDDTPVVYNF
jgi:hypothetical protein